MTLFVKQSYSVSGVNWPIIECCFKKDLNTLIRAWAQAQQKSLFTMNPSQSGRQRNKLLKLNKQFMGILGEIGCKKYLERVLLKNNLSEEWGVLRYDDIRTDGFKSPKNEFDIKIQNKKNAEEFVLVESRSSITHNRSLQDGLNQFDIIGPYSSDNKPVDKRNDIYIRPLFEWVGFESNKYDDCLFKHYAGSGQIKLYIVAGCVFDEVVGNASVKKSMGQGSTIYSVLPIKSSTNPIQFQKVIIDKLNERTKK